MAFEDTSRQPAEDFGSMTAGMEQEIDPKIKDRTEKYVDVLMKLIHAPETRDQVIDMLGGETIRGTEGETQEQATTTKDPYMTVPLAANQVNKMGLAIMERGGIQVGHDIQFASSQYLVSDLIELGNASGAFEATPEDFIPIYEDTLEMFVQAGLKDGSIDPIKLQADVEQFMTPEQKRGGLAVGQRAGVNTGLQDRQMMEQVGTNARMEERTRLEDRYSKERARDQGQALQVMQGGQ